MSEEIIINGEEVKIVKMQKGVHKKSRFANRRFALLDVLQRVGVP